MSGAADGGPVLLDTCALIWLFMGAAISPRAEQRIIAAGLGAGILVSPVSAWEIGLLARPRAGRPALTFLPDPRTWFARVLARPGIRLTPLTPEVAIDASTLPEPLHADPADRMLIATARHAGAAVVTRDEKIIAYAAAGHVALVAC